MTSEGPSGIAQFLRFATLPCSAAASPGVTAEQRLPLQVETLATALLHKSQAILVDGERVGLSADVEFATQRPVEFRRHRGTPVVDLQASGRATDDA
ncbi:hypothetical protein ACVWWW_000698 [Lysobacter sp. HA18]